MTLLDTLNGPFWLLWVTAILSLVISVILLTGHFSGFIAGYNTASEEVRQKYDKLKLCRVAGSGLGIISVMLILMAALCRVLPYFFAYIFMAVTLITAVLIIVLCNTICKIK